MKTLLATFRKKDGTHRMMHFAKLEDLPEAYLESKLKGSEKKRTLAEGMEVVWDVENSDFRVFNWNTVLGVPKEIEMKELEA